MALKSYTQEDFTNLLAQFYPDGRLYEAKWNEDKNLRKLIKAYSMEHKRFYDLMLTFMEERDPRTTDIFLEDWESALGIPDDCIPLGSTKQERRDNIVLKLTSLSIQTEQDYINLAAVYGFTIDFVEDSVFPYEFPFIFATSSDEFVWIIRGDFASDPANAIIFQCLVRKLTTAVYKVVFVEA